MHQHFVKSAKTIVGVGLIFLPNQTRESTMKVEVISKESIRPSSSTPHHLRHYQLSFLDQISPPIFMPFIMFFPNPSNSSGNNNSIASKSRHLKTHLSEALTRFYPLAGRMLDNRYVDCNDEGVPFVEAIIDVNLSEITGNPIPCELNQLLAGKIDEPSDLPMTVQANFFRCGGLAVGVGMSHKVADALAFFSFLNIWAAIARGEEEIPSPKFESAALFPPADCLDFKPSTGIVKDDIVTKRFVFSASKISSLRERYTKTLTPTRIEALSSFIWSRFVASTQGEKPDPSKIYTVLHTVNLRPKFEPPLSDHHFGNISRIAIAVPSMDSEEPSYGVVNKVREVIKKVDREFVAKLQRGAQEHTSLLKERGEMIAKGELIPFSFTSLCRFPLHEADFGWGKPAWVASASMPFKNLVSFLDTASGRGIEAWVNLKAQDMARFEVDEELLAFAD